MMGRNNIRKTFIIIGSCCIVSAVALLLVWQWNIHASQQKAKAYVEVLNQLLPQVQGAVPQDRRDNTMATLCIDGTDFAGILEFPQYASVLPVCADWGKSSRYPCRFGGSIYDRSMQIGATSQKGQYDFYRDISAGDSVFFTDMEGNRYGYTVTDIRYENHIDSSVLQRRNASLTLFIKNIYAFEYIIIDCDIP